MCLILFAWQAHPDYELILGANRDEFHARPAAPAAFWDSHPHLLAGRDLQAGGTWMGITKQGRFAAITNYRESGKPVEAEQSRGALVLDYLLGQSAPDVAAAALNGGTYSGFNLLLGAPGRLAYASNRGRGPESVKPGVHALSNHLLDTDWPKAVHGCERLTELLHSPVQDSDKLFDLLGDPARVGGNLPGDVEPKLAPEELMRHLFIRSPQYGTRCSTVLMIGRDGRVYFEERGFSAAGEETARVVREFVVAAAERVPLSRAPG